MKKKCLSLLTLSFIFLQTSAQFTIKGIVKDSLTQAPIPDANIIVEETFLTAETDNHGKFVFKNIKPGKKAIQISFIGYKTTIKEIDISNDVDIEVFLPRDIVMADEVIVSATRASDKTAMAFKNFNKEEIAKRNFGQDVPFILSLTPSVVVTSDAGNGIGYTGIRMRGSDATRINVTINGIPINDAESQQLYWVDLPDIATSIDNVQVQRGVGTSTNGAGAFGGSINIQTNRLHPESYVESNHAHGSFGTIKNNISFGTGLLNNHWTFDARLSKINSDGYIDRGNSDLKSIYISEGYYGKKSIVRLNIFSGKEITYQSWYGTPESRIKNDATGMNEYVIRNGLDSDDSLNLLNAGRTYNFYTYKNQVDDYQQDNYQLHYSLQLTDKFIFNTSLHYTKGKGYYEEYKKQNDPYGEGAFSFYGLPDVIIGDDTIISTNLIRRKWLDNDFYGTTYSVQYDSHNKTSLTIGGGWNQYDGDHLDEIISAQYFPLTEFPYGYENNSALKTDFNIFGKMIFDLNTKTNLLADMQFRRVSYHFMGFDSVLNYVPRQDKLDFMNPKIGFNWKPGNEHNTYVSFSLANKEPSRDDYVSSSSQSKPKAENMQDLEAGYRFQKSKYAISFNFYFMNYRDQLVLTGEVNDVGNYIRTNINKSYRTGIEVELEIRPLKQILFSANATLSRNKIEAFNQFIDDYDVGVQVIREYKNTDIAFSPNIISSAIFTYNPFKEFSISFNTKYVGKQFLDNTSDESKKIKAYTTSDVQVNYSFHSKLIKEINLGLMLNNIFNRFYESNGYTWNYIYGGAETVENFYYPQAGINFLGQVSLKF